MNQFGPTYVTVRIDWECREGSDQAKLMRVPEGYEVYIQRVLKIGDVIGKDEQIYVRKVGT